MIYNKTCLKAAVNLLFKKRRRLSPREISLILQVAPDQIIRLLGDICLNIYRDRKNNLQISKKCVLKLRKGKRFIRKVAKTKDIKLLRKQLTVQSGGAALAFLLPLIASAVGPLLSTLIDHFKK